MKRAKSVFGCQECGYENAKWLGKCPGCGCWNSLVETGAKSGPKKSGAMEAEKAAPLRPEEVPADNFERYRTELEEFDRVVGGGVVKGSLCLLGGEPGIGKSTLLMEVCGRLAAAYPEKKILYVSGEESAAQVAARSKRLGVESGNFYILNETCWQNVADALKRLKPAFFVVDSIQTTASADVSSPAGAPGQVREVTYEIMNYAKRTGCSCFVIGHVTKEGQIAGPKLLEHMVDTVVYFEGERQGQYRLLRSTKNRFGEANEIGVFEMGASGLKQAKNPSSCFFDEGLGASHGRALTCVLEGTRPLFVETQALVVENKFGNGRRATQGVENNRLALLVAIIDKYFEVPLSLNDIYLNVAGGVKLDSRESDLAILASLLSSFYSKALPEGTIFIGEAGLGGEIRAVSGMERRLKEIKKMNYKKVVTSARAAKELGRRFDLECVGISKTSELRRLFA